MDSYLKIRMPRSLNAYLLILINQTVYLTCDRIVSQAGRQNDGVLEVVFAFVLEVDFGLAHIVQHGSDHGQEKPTDEENGLAPRLLLSVPRMHRYESFSASYLSQSFVNGLRSFGVSAKR